MPKGKKKAETVVTSEKEVATATETKAESKPSAKTSYVYCYDCQDLEDSKKQYKKGDEVKGLSEARLQSAIKRGVVKVA